MLNTMGRTIFPWAVLWSRHKGSETIRVDTGKKIVKSKLNLQIVAINLKIPMGKEG